MREFGIKIMRLNDRNEMTSLAAPTDLITRYRVREWAESRYPLFFFGPDADENSAAWLVSNLYMGRIALAWVIAEDALDLPRIMVMNRDRSHRDYFWHKVKARQPIGVPTRLLPMGTRAAKRLYVHEILYAGDDFIDLWMPTFARMRAEREEKNAHVDSIKLPRRPNPLTR